MSDDPTEEALFARWKATGSLGSFSDAELERMDASMEWAHQTHGVVCRIHAEKVNRHGRWAPFTESELRILNAVPTILASLDDQHPDDAAEAERLRSEILNELERRILA